MSDATFGLSYEAGVVAASDWISGTAIHGSPGTPATRIKWHWYPTYRHGAATASQGPAKTLKRPWESDTWFGETQKTKRDTISTDVPAARQPLHAPFQLPRTRFTRDISIPSRTKAD